MSTTKSVTTTSPSISSFGSTKKFEHVSHKINTGASILEEKRKQAAKNFTKKSNEMFKRIRTKTLAQFFEEEGFSNLLQLEPNEKSFIPLTKTNLSNVEEKAESPIVPKQPLPDEDERKKLILQRKYLILDLRLKEEYEKCRVRTAIHYPYTNLSKATNELISEMYSFKNREGKLIIVYDEDETLAPTYANILFQKGIDNIYLLSGGLRDLYEKFPKFVIGGIAAKPGTVPSPKINTNSSTSSSDSPPTTAISNLRLSKTTSSTSKPWK